MTFTLFMTQEVTRRTHLFASLILFSRIVVAIALCLRVIEIAVKHVWFNFLLTERLIAAVILVPFPALGPCLVIPEGILKYARM